MRQVIRQIGRQHPLLLFGLIALGIAAFVTLAAPRAIWAQDAGQAEQAAAPTATVEVVVEAPAQVAAGELIPLTLRLSSAAPLGAAEAQWLYQPSALEFAGYNLVTPTSGPATGRLILPLLPTGAVVGFYTCGTAPCVEVYPAQAQAAGADLTTTLTVELIPLSTGSLEIKLAALQVVDAQGRPLPVNLSQQTLTVQVGDDTTALPAPPAPWEAVASTASAEAVTAAAADVASDGTLDHADIMEVALGWQIVREGSGPCGGAEAQADVNGDGCVDVVDVQLAAVFTGAGDVPVEPETPNLPEASERIFLPQLSTPGGSTLAEGAATTDSRTFVVDSTMDDSDARWGDGICLAPSGGCTLRAAIAEANAHKGGPDYIHFNIPGDGVQVIQLSSRLPTLNDTQGGTTIDGYTQPGASPNSDPLISNAQIRIEIRGNGFNNFDGLVILTADNTVRGLSFYNFKRPLWIYGAAATDDVIAGNFVGTNAAGTFAANVTSELQAHGINVEQGARRIRIGGVDPADRNVISGNARHGIGLWHTGTRDNLVYNNIIGLSPDGTRRLSNRVHGIDMNYGASYNIVGGQEPGKSNLVSGNGGQGIEASHTAETSQNQIIGNRVGTDATGNNAPNYAYNGGIGISIKDRVTNNLVAYNVVGNNRSGGIVVDNFGNCCTSGTLIYNNRVGIGLNGGNIGNSLAGISLNSIQSRVGPGNIVTNNPVGVEVVGNDSLSNTITQNSIFGNTGLGIDLGPLGEVNVNDPDDADGGPNGRANYPSIETAEASQVTGRSCPGCTVEVFVSDGTAGQYGEGRTFIGTTVVAADGTYAVAVSGVAEGDYVSATTTDLDGNTSEFSPNRVVGIARPWEVVHQLPGRIEVENYRLGGPNVAYLDTTSGNSGRAYRIDDVDIEVAQDSSGSYNIGYIAPGEWLTYDINVPQAGEYRITARVSAPTGNRYFRIEIDGNNVSGSVRIPWSGGWQNWINVPVTVNLPAGDHTLKFVAETDRFNLNYLDIAVE